MNKDELLKIYSAYLPYGMKAQYNNGDIITIIGVNTETIQVNSDFTHYGYSDTRIEDVKPILYDLSYLTKEDLRYAGFDDHIDFLTNEREVWIKKYGRGNYIKKLPHGHFEYLVSNHYNIFGIPEGEYINKANL